MRLLNKGVGQQVFQREIPAQRKLTAELLEDRRLLASWTLQDELVEIGPDTRWAAAGTSVAIDGDYAVVGAPRAWSGSVRGGAAYVYLRDDQGTQDDATDDTWGLQAKLIASDATGIHEFGSVVDISGDTIVVGDRISDSAYVFVRQGSSWSEQQQFPFLPPDGYLEIDVAIDGDTIVLGGGPFVRKNSDNRYVFSPVVHVMSRTGTTWTTEQQLTLPQTFNTPFPSVCVDDNTIAVGIVHDSYNGPGAVYVFARDIGQWTLQQKLHAPPLNDEYAYFGWDVSLSGDVLAVGSWTEADQAGAAHVFVRNQDTWEHQRRLTGAESDGWGRFGRTVSVSGDTLIVGAPRADDPEVGSGTAYIFSRTDGDWSLTKRLVNPGPGRWDYFGDAVAADGRSILAGIRGDDDEAEHSGSAQFYGANSAGLWEKTVKLIVAPVYGESGERAGNVGRTATADGNYVVLGANGSAHIFQRNDQGTPYDVTDDAWDFQTTVTPGDLNVRDFDDSDFGHGVALSGDTLAVSAPVDYGCCAIGYVSVFRRSGNDWVEEARLMSPEADQASWDQDYFGNSVSLHGDTLVVGALRGNTVYVFVRNGSGQWKLRQTLTGSSGDGFGHAVAVHEDTMVIRSTNLAQADVYTRVDGTWSFLEAEWAPKAGDEWYGKSVAIDGDTFVITDEREAYVYTRDQGAWRLQQEVSPSAVSWGLAVRGDLLVVGRYVFRRSGDTWRLSEELSSPRPQESIGFGSAAAITDNTVIIGAKNDTVDRWYAGRGYAYSYTDFDMAVDVTKSVDRVVAGLGSQVLSFTATVASVGESYLTGVGIDIEASLPAGVEFVSTRGDGQLSINGTGTASWEIGDLAAGHGVEMTFTYRVSAAATAGSEIELRASNLRANQSLENVADDEDSEHISIVATIGSGTVSVGSQADLTVARVPTPYDRSATGEVDVLPEDEPWIDEWTEFWAEIWVSTPDVAGPGIAGAVVDLTYGTEYFTAVEVEAGPSFTQQLTWIIDDETGRVSGLGGYTSLSHVGSDWPVLLARVRFMAGGGDAGVPHNAVGKYPEPLDDIGLRLDSASVARFGNVPETPDLGSPPATELWPVIYDIDNDGRSGFGDFAYFAECFLQSVESPATTYAYACDFDRSGSVGFPDLAYFARSFGRTAADTTTLVYPPGFPESWRRIALRSAEPPPAAPVCGTTPITEELLGPAVREAVAQVEAVVGKRPELADLTFEIVELPEDLLGQVTGDTIIKIDADAAGYGWFVDNTPWDDTEFTNQLVPNERSSSATSPARGRFDLLTTVMHELGHILGLRHADGGLMGESLSLGTRRVWDDESVLDVAMEIHGMFDATALTPATVDDYHANT